MDHSARSFRIAIFLACGLGWLPLTALAVDADLGTPPSCSKGAHALSATVAVIVNKSVDVDAFRHEVRRVLADEGSALWDGRYPNLLVTENPDGTLVLRVLVGAKDRSGTWPLRAMVQHRLEALLAGHQEWLPRTMGEGAPAH